MDIENLTIKQVRELIALLGVGSSGKSHSFEIGKAYLVRTVTYATLGKLVGVTDTDLMFDQASWVADTGRFGRALATGALHEVEFAGDGVLVERGALVDAFPWRHGLPMESK